MPERERVLSWEEPQQLEVVTRVRPAATPLGGRPQELTWLGPAIFWDDRHEWYEHMHRRLKELARSAVARFEPGRAVGTLALGWDTAFLEVAGERHIPVTVILPFRGVQARWALHHRQRFGRLLERAERTEVIHEGYEAWTYAAAARACVEASDLALALWDGEDDHVRRDLEHARERELEAVNLWGSWRTYGGLSEAS